jgi:uncharacterized cupin superfamily protein
MSKGYAHINFNEVEDLAIKFGMQDTGEARYLCDDVGAESIGASLYRMRAGKRTGFGHSHEEVEELYVVVEGDGRVKIDDEIIDLAPWDAVRVAAPQVREFEAGDGGMTLLAFGNHVKGDGNMQQDFWPTEDQPAA